MAAAAQPSLSPATVATLLADPATRGQTLDGLEQHDGPHAAALALRTAQALTDVMCLDAAEVPHALYQRVGLLRGRLMIEAVDPVAVYGAVCGGGRVAKEMTAPSVGFGGLLQKTAEQLDLDDARSFACGFAVISNLGCSYSWTRTFAAAGFGSAMELLGMFMAEHPIVSAKRCPVDDKPIRMLSLLVDLLRSGELPDVAIGGAFFAANFCIQARPAVAAVALELGVIELASAQLSRIGEPADWLSVARSSSNNAGRGHLNGAACAVCSVKSGFKGGATRPDQDAVVSSGLVDQMLSVLRAFERAGVEGMQSTDVGGIFFALGILSDFSHPACNAQMRGSASTLSFAMDHSLDYCEELGWTTGSIAAVLCEISRVNLSLVPRCSWFCPDSLLSRCCCLSCRLRRVRP